MILIIVIQPREMGIFSGRGSGSGCSVATAHPIPQVTCWEWHQQPKLSH